MKQFKLNIVNRKETGRGPARRIRKAGRIPACVYAKGNSRPIELSAVEFRSLNKQIGGGAALVELTDEGGITVLTLIQETYHHPLKDTVDHIDFKEVSHGESLIAHMPIHIKGESDAYGVKNEGGLIELLTHSIDVRCRPSKLPEYIDVDVTALKVGDALHIRDLSVLDDVEFLGEPDQVIVCCAPPTVPVEKPDVEASVETVSEQESKDVDPE